LEDFFCIEADFFCNGAGWVNTDLCDAGSESTYFSCMIALDFLNPFVLLSRCRAFREDSGFVNALIDGSKINFPIHNPNKSQNLLDLKSIALKSSHGRETGMLQKYRTAYRFSYTREDTKPYESRASGSFSYVLNTFPVFVHKSFKMFRIRE